MSTPPRPDPADPAVERVLEDGTQDTLLREEPLWIEVSGHRVLTMRTPGDDLNLAVGFLLSEGVIDGAAAVAGAHPQAGDIAALRPDTIALDVETPRARLEGRLTRTHEIRSSCGICGLVNPEELLDELPPLLPGVPRLSRADIEARRQAFEAHQLLFDRTGACHGAEIFGPDGASWGRGEDVGRHNALDKAIGAAARAGHDLTRGTAFLSGRAGFDLVLKCLRVRLPVILSVSAASALSFDLCEAADATLVGFVRPERIVVYRAAGRVLQA